jgi:hypothetical protein
MNGPLSTNGPLGASKMDETVGAGYFIDAAKSNWGDQ